MELMVKPDSTASQVVVGSSRSPGENTQGGMSGICNWDFSTVLQREVGKCFWRKHRE